ncbi:hypothetical protein AB205_0037320 [Aquarana catesbeiana]|uniref:Uncharacterized protein n=1 Tax=Aquarana catesbeiana TaxID=8400 RepID=A0A2G9R3W7_AQUCT|nr:hypothetical protein AB205_0037320 [Aquarana catesbeiana]
MSSTSTGSLLHMRALQLLHLSNRRTGLGTPDLSRDHHQSYLLGCRCSLLVRTLSLNLKVRRLPLRSSVMLSNV